ncbi:NAD(P)H-dependent oxidoreductase [Aminobacter sp. BE322]|uniref:NAD(P)H-dependent oxidoreductase n=1 Tax=unclassified Aminobacter TaxID=2644704 RepID=UPI003D19B989
MKILVLYAHPVETSFNAELHRLIVQRLEAAGHEVDDCDLYAEDFDPRLTRAERLGYHEARSDGDAVASYVRRLRSAEGLVLCFPVWNYGYPAILKGFFDRVFLPGVSFRLVDGKVVPMLHNIRKVVAVATYGGSRLRAMLMGDPPRKLVGRVLRANVRPGAPVAYLAHYSLNLSTDRTRKAFMRKVADRMDRF